MARTQTKGSETLVAREAVTIVVDARPIEYGTITVQDRHSGEMKTIDNQNAVLDAGDEGFPYTFKAGQKVRRDHPAVQANPDAFIPLDELDSDDSAPVLA